MAAARLVIGGASSATRTAPSDKSTPSEIAQGPFQPTWESLKQYKCPDWFRDAKFGIWAHWGPQAVPMVGDWYARKCTFGRCRYVYHLKTFGHPSQFGYKDIIPLWKAEKWDPDRLMALYKKAGARYFVSQAVHHDNFDLWNSKYHRWNAVAMGPKRDMVGDWQKAAKKQGLPFGVSEHLGASLWFFSPVMAPTRPVPKRACPTTAPTRSIKTSTIRRPPKAIPQWYSNDPDGTKSGSSHRRSDRSVSSRFVVQRRRRALRRRRARRGRPFLQRESNSTAASLEAVYNCKNMPEIPGPAGLSPGTCVQDMERGVLAGINPTPWQTDTSIGDWFYNRNWKYRNAGWVIHTLVDIVSKNGNLLLNVVQRPDGSLDPEVEQLLLTWPLGWP